MDYLLLKLYLPARRICCWKYILRCWKCISRCRNYISRCWKCISRCRKCISRCRKCISRCRKFISRCRRSISRCRNYISRCRKFISKCRRYISKPSESNFLTTAKYFNLIFSIYCILISIFQRTLLFFIPYKIGKPNAKLKGNDMRML
jgi:hypothetical protein